MKISLLKHVLPLFYNNFYFGQVADPSVDDVVHMTFILDNDSNHVRVKASPSTIYVSYFARTRLHRNALDGPASLTFDNGSLNFAIYAENGNILSKWP